MQNVRVERYNDPQGRTHAIVKPEDESWKLVWLEGEDPELWIRVVYEKDESGTMHSGFTPAIFCQTDLLEAIQGGPLNDYDREAAVKALGCPNAAEASS